MKAEIKQRITQLNNGEVPNGYEKTEFGIFPCDWVKDKNFGDLFDFYGGLGKSRDELGEEGHAYLHYGDLHRGAFNVVSHEQYEQLPKYDVTLKGNETYLMEDGDVAFLDASEDLEGTSRAVLIDNPNNEPFIAGLHIIYGKSKDESIEKWYKQYITTSESVRKQFQRLAAGFKVYGVNRDTLPRIQVAYPKSIEEQSKIATILMKWDEAIELREKHIEVLKKRQKALMQKLLTPCETWPKHRLGDICDIRTGNKNTQDNVPTGAYPFFVRSSQVERINSYSYEGEAILIPGDGNIGEIFHYINGKFDYHQRVYKISDSKTVEMKYLYYYLKQNLKRRVISLSAKATVDSLRMDMLTDMTIAVCPKHNDVVDVLCLLDNEIEINENIIKQIKQQRKALQKYLLTGIVRV